MKRVTHSVTPHTLLDASNASQRFVVATGLPGVVPADGMTVDDLVAVTGWAAEHRLTGLLFAAASVISAGGPDESDRSDVLGGLADARLATLRQGLAVEVEALRAVNELRGVGIAPIVFKGVASAHLDHVDPGDRTFYDVDLLVARESFGRAADCLERAGWTRVPSALGRRWEERYARAAQFVAPSGVEVDLHAALAAGYFGVRLDDERLARSVETFDLGGTEVTSFDADARLLTSCYALVLSRGGSARLVRDIAQQIIVTGASWRRAASLAGEGEVVIAHALQTVDPWIELPDECMEWARAVRTTRRQQFGLSLAAGGHDHGWRNDLAGELLGLGMVDRVRSVAGVASHRLRSVAGRPGGAVPDPGRRGE